MVSLNRLTRKKLGEILLEQNLITEEQIQDALRVQHQQGVLFGQALVEQGLITEDKIVSVLIEQFGIPYIRPTEYEISTDLLEIFEPSMMRRFQFVPLDSIGSILIVAIAGPLNEELLNTFENETGCTVQPFLTKMSEIDDVLKKYEL